MIRAGLALLSLVSTVAQGAEVRWLTDSLQWRGVGCQFGVTEARPQDAWAVASGSDLSFVFSNLGQIFRQTRREGVDRSNCWVAVPAEIPEGQYISSITQTILYGIIKPVGARVRIVARTDFVLARPNLGGPGILAGAEAIEVFPQNEAVSISLAEMSNNVNPRYRRNPQRAEFRTDRGPRSMHARFCRRGRPRQGWLLSEFAINVNQGTAETPVIISVDGADTNAGLAMRAELSACDPGVRP